MKHQMRKLALPGGGYIELPMPNDARVFVNTPSPSMAGPADGSSVLVPVLIGGVLGALITWGALKVFR